MDLLIRNGQLLDRPDPVDVLVSGGRFAAIRPSRPTPADGAALVLRA
jgi:dihydroorotase-like cyclic amidohydrolase